MTTAPASSSVEDLEEARRRIKEKHGEAAVTLAVRQRAILWTIVGLVALGVVLAVGVSVSVALAASDRAVSTSVAVASQQRLDGIAQAQARQATQDAMPANARLAAAGFPPVPIPGVYDAPAADVVNTAAAARVLATVPPADLRAGNAAVLGPATDALFDTRVVPVSQSGPTRIRVASIAYQYMQLLRVGAVPRATVSPIPPPAAGYEPAPPSPPVDVPPGG